jgi:hydrogenase small subunit
MPGFPDKFTPFYTVAPGSRISTSVSRVVGRVIRPLRLHTNEHLNREVRWDLNGETPSGWAREKPEPGIIKETSHRFYDTLRRSSDRGKRSSEEWGKRSEWADEQRPAREAELPGGAGEG